MAKKTLRMHLLSVVCVYYYELLRQRLIAACTKLWSNIRSRTGSGHVRKYMPTYVCLSVGFLRAESTCRSESVAYGKAVDTLLKT